MSTEPAPLLTAETRVDVSYHSLGNSTWQPTVTVTFPETRCDCDSWQWTARDNLKATLVAIRDGRVACYDTETHVAVPKMTEEQAREKARDLFAQDSAQLRQLDPWAAHMLGYLAALRDAGVIK